MPSDQSGLTGRTREPGIHYHEGSAYSDAECHCPLSKDKGQEPGTCLACGGEPDGLCVICDSPVCYDHAVLKDFDRLCQSCMKGNL